MGEKKGAGKLPLALCISDVIDPKYVQIDTYIGAQCIGNCQKKKNKTKPKAITRIKWEETRNCNKNTKVSKAGEQCWRGE